MVIAGPGTVSDGAKAASLAEIEDGASNTILVVEVVGTGVNWAQPVDLDVGNMQFPNVTGGSAGPDSHHPGGLNAVLCDGSVRFLSETMDRQVLDALITKGGNELIPSFWYILFTCDLIVLSPTPSSMAISLLLIPC